MHICSSSEYSSESRIPIINNPDEKTIYLVPASYQPSNNMFTEWVYVNNTWEIFGSVAIDLSNYLTDVQINGTSIVTDGVAEMPIAMLPKSGYAAGNFGVVALKPYRGIAQNNEDKSLYLAYPLANELKQGIENFKAVTISAQHSATFYGLAKVAGHDEKNSTLPVGTYSEEAKTAIQTMLDVPSTNTVSTLSDAVNDLDSDVQGLQTTVQDKADTATVTALSGTVTGLQTSKADKSYVDTQLAGKASTATATASSDGLMSSADKTKLDAVYADYTSALTALGVIE